MMGQYVPIYSKHWKILSHKNYVAMTMFHNEQFVHLYDLIKRSFKNFQIVHTGESRISRH